MSEISSNPILRSLADTNFLNGTLMERMGMEIVSASAEETVVSMPVSGNTQPFGFLHGGASGALAETAASICGAIAAYPNLAFGKELNIRHLRPVRAEKGTEKVFATAKASANEGTISYDVEVKDEDGNLVAKAKLEVAVVPSKTEQ